jgi:DNA helicase-2/ATP-dependent DNA helicase PcrA
VVITGLEDELFPFKGYRAQEDEPITDGLLSPEEEDLEEERRLAYVAITRARQSLTLCYAAQRMLFGQTRYNRPSRFLRDLPQDDLKMHASARQSFVPRGWGSAPASQTFQRVPFVHPQAAPPSRAPGERFVEIDPEVAHENLRRGKHVRHKKFGEGRIIEILEGGVEPKVVAQFPGWGTMTVLQRFLEIVDGTDV